MHNMADNNKKCFLLISILNNRLDAVVAMRGNNCMFDFHIHEGI